MNYRNMNDAELSEAHKRAYAKLHKACQQQLEAVAAVTMADREFMEIESEMRVRRHAFLAPTYDPDQKDIDEEREANGQTVGGRW